MPKNLYTENTKRLMLKAIRKHISQYGFPPSRDELCVLTNIPAKSTVTRYLRLMREEGIITYIDNKARTLRIVESLV